MEKIKSAIKNLKQPILVSIILMVICGLAFPLLLTGLSSVFFKDKANGSIIEINGISYGSEYVGQDFTKPYFMHGRPSAVNYNTYTEDENGNKTYLNGEEFSGVASGSQNLAPSSEKLKQQTSNLLEKFLEENPKIKKEDIPTDLLTASGSGLDPHISPKSAQIQIPRIVDSSNISEEKIKQIISDNTTGKFLGVFGEETVNVLGVNIDIATEMGIIK